MTHPDPYIEEWKEFEKEFYKLTATMDGQYRPKLLLLFRNLYETQQSATKAQRIKDIEEIEPFFEQTILALVDREDWETGRKFVREFLTSRKAAIEEV